MTTIELEATKSIKTIDWNTWKPTHTATLVFVRKQDQLLLIHKKRGLGAGKINAPGGKLNPKETIEDCAIRETQEELCITPIDLIHCGENLFQFIDGYSIHVHNYYTNKFTGTPTETEEAKPLWVDINNIPYDKMWEDDIMWLPQMLAGKKFKGRYLFDKDKLLDHKLEIFNM